MRNKHTSLTLGLLSASIALCLAPQVRAATPGAAESPASPQSSTAEATPATQQGATSDRQPKKLETIVVTARLRGEDIEKVPVAISAFSADDLRNLQAVDITGLQGAVPNLNIVQGRGSSSNANIFIRGIGQPDALQTFDPGIGFYVDGVYYSRINGQLMDLYDVERVEVLRGPQGTLYGMNSTGGAIKVITRKPTDTPEGAVGLTVGDHGRIDTHAYLSGPLGKTVSGSIAVGTFKNNGYVTDPDTNEHFNDDNTQAIRGKLDFHPSDRLNVTLSMDYTHQNTALTMGQPTAPLVSVDLAPGFPPSVLLLPTPWDFQARTSFSPDQGQKLINEGIAMNTVWRINDNWTYEGITAYRKLDTSAYIDIDASQFQLGDVLVQLRQHQYSSEYQLHYDNHDNLHAVMGLYFLDEHVPSHQEAYADDFLTFFGTPIDFTRTIDDDLENKSYAGFANATWAFAEDWNLSAGVRYTYEKKDYFRTTTAYFGPPLSAFDNTFAFTDSKSWSAVTPSVALQKQINPETMWYASANRGFKAGGFNGRANAPSDVSSFDPEFVWTYETGMKFRSADGRLQADGDVFYSNYEDFQARVSDITNPDDPIPTFGFPVLNAAKLTMYGAEFSGSMLVGASSSLQAQIGYLNASYDEFYDPRVAIDPSLAGLHDHVAFTPKWTARVAATHTFNLHGGSAFTLGGDVSYRDDMWLSVDNRPGLMQPAYTLVGLYGVFDSSDGHWQVRGGVRNLTDKAYKTDAQEFASVGNIQTAYYGWPRNYYLSVRYNFFQ